MKGLPLSRFTGMLATNSSLRSLWLARAVSALGDYGYSVALMWFVYEQTHSALQTGLLFILKFLPEPFVGLYFGVLADRLNRKRLMQIADLIQTLAMLLLGVLIARAVSWSRSSAWPGPSKSMRPPFWCRWFLFSGFAAPRPGLRLLPRPERA
ncbi:MFS transporter [Brevibacillus thermoruber]|uniref:MFS transporter n=1 Tax=Brevibacillus thermoruber TaxID=33942 RepID=A0A9X3TSA4_9BACL|nr:MFS transporter [Brevibacillus thermoruber]MDA5109528.1 MFS transporter [Brevibacillus thermoruber]